MNKNRSQEEIIADILSAILNQPKKTRIMYAANLSYALLCKYLDKLVKCGLVNYRKEDRIYELTVKGEDYLGNYAEYEHLRDQLEASQSSLNEKEGILMEILKVDNPYGSSLLNHKTLKNDAISES